MKDDTVYDRRRHAAVRTDAFVFHQLIPYIGNKRRLLGLLREAILATNPPAGALFVDYFAGSGVVSRMAKKMGFRVHANDWEPYAKAINTCYIARNGPPRFGRLGGYERAIATLNDLTPRVDWITEHLCPRDDIRYNIGRDRMFYMRKNGMRIDAIRHQIAGWTGEGLIDEDEAACLLAPLLYQACYTSNTSGVFKGFHNGWGGQTGTALYRIAGDLLLAPAKFFNNRQPNRVSCEDAAALAEELRSDTAHIAYLDPPYNQHPYGSNYHVLNTIALWDKPDLTPQISRGTKAAIRLDWRTERRSAYNYRQEAAAAYAALVERVNSRYILTSYSTDGMIALDELLAANVARGHVTVFLQGYKRYRVSSQRFSKKPMNVEIILVLDTGQRSERSVAALRASIERAEQKVLARHPETNGQDSRQLSLFAREAAGNG